MPGRFSALLDPARVNLQVQNTQRTAVLREVSQLLADHPAVLDFPAFFEQLLARDQLDTTSLGHGFAVPHARTEHVSDIILAVGRSDQGIPFDSGDDVRMIFMLGTPVSRPGDYLQILGTLCRLLKEPANRQAFLGAVTPADFVRAVESAEQQLQTVVMRR